MSLSLDTEQLRVLNWRAFTKDIAAVVGPPGCGKTTVGSALAIKMIAECIAKRVLLVAYTMLRQMNFVGSFAAYLAPKQHRNYALGRVTQQE